MTTALAIYAAVVATAGLIWQIYSWRHRRRTEVEVSVSLGEVHVPGLWQSAECVMVKAINRSEHPVRWTGAALASQTRRGEWLMPTAFAEGTVLPAVIQPRDSHDVLWEANRLVKDLDFAKPVTAIAWLAAGEEFRSKPTVLRQPQSG
jgi:hypothetical protein